MAVQNGTKTALILHGITWALLATILTLGIMIRNNDLDHIYQEVRDIRQAIQALK